MSAANATAFSEGIRSAFAVLAQKQHAVENARALYAELPGASYRRRVSALKAAQTKASKVFARACFAEGFDDAQAVADQLTKAEEQVLRLGIMVEVDRLEQAASKASAAKRCPSCGAELELHLDGTVSTPFFPTHPIRGAELPRRERSAPFYACPNCEHCEEATS